MKHRITTGGDLTDRHRALTSALPRASTPSRTVQPSFGGTAEGPLLEACKTTIPRDACLVPLGLRARSSGRTRDAEATALQAAGRSVAHIWQRVTSGDRTHLPGFTVQCLNHFGFGHHDAPWILPAVSRVLTRDFSATYAVITVRLRGSSRRGQYTIRTCGPLGVNEVLFR